MYAASGATRGRWAFRAHSKAVCRRPRPLPDAEPPRRIGDPARIVLGETGTEEDLRELRERMGLEDPLHVQYARFVAGMATFDFGETFRYGISKPLAHGGLPESRETLPIALDRLRRPFS